MKADQIRTKLGRYHRSSTDAIVLEVLAGKPDSPEGGLWIEVPVATLEAITEKPDFDPKASGYNKHFQKWYAEGLLP